jgi:glycosyltransferase involved in cell wall biosynthesis
VTSSAPTPAPRLAAPAAAPTVESAHLIINDELPIFPGSGGVEYLTTLHLPRSFDHVGLVSMAHRRADLERARGLVEAGVRLYLWESPHLDLPPSTALARRGWLRRLHALVSRALVAWRAWPNRPHDTVLADSSFRNLSRSVIEALSARPWPVVSVVQSHAARFIEYLPRPAVSVLVMHDVRALIFERRARIISSWIERLRCRRDARRYRRFEREYCQRFDLVVTVSDRDADYVREHYAPHAVMTRRLPIDASYWEPQTDDAIEPNLTVFTGLMSHPPNVDAAVFMAREVLPRIRAEVPGAKFCIVGRHPHPDVLALASLPGVQVTGEVPDVRPWLARAAVVVVPLRFGSGSRQKILEAWAMQKCVVSTTIGAEGLDFADGVNLSLADGAEALAERVVRGLRDPGWRESLCRAGRRVVIERHDPQAIAEDFAQHIAQTGARRAASRPPMRVVIDMRWMLPGVAGGIEQVARAFVRELLAIDRHNHYTLIVPARIGHGFDLRAHPRVRWTSLDGPSAYARRLSAMARRHVLAGLRLDDWQSADVMQLRWARSLDAEMVYAFPGYTHPDLHVLPQVLMVPDIQHEYCPQFFSEVALIERTRLYRDSIARATHLCAISEFTRQTLIERLGVAPEKVTTIPLAADPIFRADGDPSADAKVLRAHGLEPGQYIFFPGHTWRHKNHATAVRAMTVLQRRHGHRLPLVCSGGAREAQETLHEEIAAADLESTVRFLGYAPRNHLPALYRHAACLLFPSLFEGFGMPVLEAMASGCPVVCSNTTSLPEIAGDAAVLVDPTDAEGMAAAMARILEDAELARALVARGRTQAGRFSWRRHTMDTLRVLHDVGRGLSSGAT